MSEHRDIAEKIITLFFIRLDAYVEASLNEKAGKTEYFTARKYKNGPDIPLTVNIVEKHLQGDTIGAYQLSHDKVMWGCEDFDMNTAEDFENAKKLYETAKRMGYHPLMELSGGGDYKCHVWIFGNAKASDMKALMEEIIKEAGTKGHETFPKQLVVALGKYGNLVKVPLGLHKVTGKRSVILDDKYEPITDDANISERLQYQIDHIDTIRRPQHKNRRKNRKRRVPNPR